MKKYGKLAGLPEPLQHPHCLKHSIATHLIEARADIRFVQDALGHKEIESPFASILLRPNAMKQLRTVRCGVHLIFQLMKRQEA